jgi:hypothetical protein
MHDQDFINAMLLADCMDSGATVMDIYRMTAMMPTFEMIGLVFDAQHECRLRRHAEMLWADDGGRP